MVKVEYGGQRLVFAYRCSYGLECVGRGKRVAGIEKEHVVAGGLRHGAVHGIVESFVRLRGNAHVGGIVSVEALLLVGFGQLQRVVG